MNTPTDWVSAIAILASGLILGLLFVVFFNRRKSAPKLGSEGDLVRKDLEAKRDALIQQLRDLGENATPQERKRLELETADVLRQLDEHKGVAAVAPAAASTAADTQPAATSSMNPALKGFLWGAASFAVLAGLGWFVMNQANPRNEGGSVTGGMMGQQQQQAQAAPAPDPVVLQLEAAVQKDPNNLKLRNDLAQAYLERDNLMGTFEQTKIVLEKSPDDSRALTFQALVRLAMGEGDSAMKMLEHASKADPKNLDSWVARAWAYAQRDKMDDAQKMIAEAAKNSPSDKARLDEVFQQMKMEVAQAKAQPQGQMAAGGQLPPGHPAVDGMQPGQAPMAGGGMAMASAAQTRPPAPNDGRSIKVTLSLAPGTTVTNGVLYVMAKNPAGGPPIAVKRMQGVSFPITFDLGSADSMMGQPLPDKFRLEARLDSDGDAATKPPTDPSAMQNDVAPGAVVKLALK